MLWSFINVAYVQHRVTTTMDGETGNIAILNNVAICYRVASSYADRYRTGTTWFHGINRQTNDHPLLKYLVLAQQRSVAYEIPDPLFVLSPLN